MSGNATFADSRWLPRPFRAGLRRWSKPASVRLHGVTLPVELGDPDTARLLWSERYERGEARCLVAHLEAHDRVLEVGAGMGYLSTLCALRVGAAAVTAFEANPEQIPKIRRTYATNGVEPTLVHGLLAEGSGTSEFFLEERFVSSSTVRRSEHGRAIQVPRYDVNQEIARLRPTLLVMDIEGGEAELVPLVRWDEASIRKIVIELHPAVLGAAGTRAVIERLQAAGFREDRRVGSTRKKYFGR
jgi:FkbM family methyltransferase